MTLRSGGLFAGYGGLDMAVAEVFGSEPAWFSEIDDAPSRILAHHWPDVPNHGDITQIDWDQVEPVDILGGGFPCQDVSLAGKRAGMTANTRSGLWSHFALGISKLRPQYVVIENVRGLLSAEAHSDVEPCPWCLGDGPGEPPLRALGAVLGDLADLGYDAEWRGLRAADVGAPHGRYRIFVLAEDAASVGGRPLRSNGSEPHRTDGSRGAGEFTAADSSELGHERSRFAWARRSGSPDGGVTTTANSNSDGLTQLRGQQPGQCDSDGRRGANQSRASIEPSALAADPAGDGWHEGWPEPAWEFRGPDAAECRDALADADRNAIREQPVSQSWRSGASVAGHAGDAASYSLSERHEQALGSAARETQGSGSFDPTDGRRGVRAAGGPDTPERGGSTTAWGQYGPAVERWERALGRIAPAPTEPNSKGSQRLSPAFVEWMMGLPAGHVTHVPDVNRNAQLKALGNGVVPQQAIAALRHMRTTNQQLLASA